MSILRRILGGSDDGDEKPESRTKVEKEVEVIEPEEANDLFMGIPEGELTGVDEKLREMTKEDRERYISDQDYSDLRTLTEKSAGAVPEIFNTVRRREVELDEIGEKVTDPDFWTEQPFPKFEIDDSLEDAEEIGKADVIDLETRSTRQQEAEFEEVVNELLDRGQYQAARDFGYLVRPQYPSEGLEPVKQLAVEKMVQETGEADTPDEVDESTKKQMFAMLDTIDAGNRVTVGEAMTYADAGESGMIDEEQVKNDSHYKMSVAGKIARKFLSTQDADGLMTTAFLDKASYTNMGNYGDLAVDQYLEEDRPAQAILAASRLDLGGDVMISVLDQVDEPEAFYQALEAPGMDPESGYGEILVEQVGEYANELAENGENEKAQEIVENYGVEDQLTPEAGLEIEKLE